MDCIINVCILIKNRHHKWRFLETFGDDIIPTKNLWLIPNYNISKNRLAYRLALQVFGKNISSGHIVVIFNFNIPSVQEFPCCKLLGL